MQRALRHSTVALSALLMLLGVAILVSALVRGGGPLSLGVLVGGAFAVLGAARMYLARLDRRPRTRG